MFEKELYENKVNELLNWYEEYLEIDEYDKEYLKNEIMNYLERNSNNTQLLSTLINKFNEDKIIMSKDFDIDEFDTKMWSECRKEYLDNLEYGDRVEKEPIIEEYVNALNQFNNVNIYILNDGGYGDNYYIIIS